MKKLLLLLLLVPMVFASLVGCVSKQQETKLLEKISELETQLDECQNGADKLHAKMKLNFSKKEYQLCKEVYLEMEKRHPDSEFFNEVKSLYDIILKEEKAKEEIEILAAKKEKQAKLKALKKLVKRKDDVSGITWYKQPYFTHYTNTNLTSIYMGDNGSSRWLRLMMSYEGDSWIFFDRAFLSYDGNTKEIIFNEYNDKSTDNDSDVWEWIDLTVNKDVESFLREFAKSKNAKMRLSGKYTKTRKLKWRERQGIIDVLNGYDALNEYVK